MINPTRLYTAPEHQQTAGFTLVEILIALFIGGVVMAAVMTSFAAQHRVYLAQDQTVEMQQNLRVAMAVISHDLRSAGYDPTFLAGAGVETATTTRIVFTRDLDGSGAIYDPATPENSEERVSYRLNANPAALGRVSGNGVVHLSVADNIFAMELLYLMADGTRQLAPANLDDIRGVQISLLARSAERVSNHTDSQAHIPASSSMLEGWTDGPGLPRDDATLAADGWLVSPANDNFRRKASSQIVMMRNMGLTRQ